MSLLKKKLDKIGVVVLSAGKGTRLNCKDKPKVMLEIGGKPIVSYIIENLKKIGFKKENIVLVVGFKKENIKKYFGDKVSYAWQKEQLGTSHATLTGIKKLPKEIKNFLVLGGDDSAFYKPETLERFLNSHLQSKAICSLLVGKITNDIQKEQIGRVVKSKNGQVKIVEKESLTKTQKELTEISTGTFIFNKAWFEENYKNQEKIKGLEEYGLPAIFDLAVKQNKKINLVNLEDNNEWFGINNEAELNEARRKISV